MRARPSRHSLGRSSFAVSPSKVDKISTFPITPPCGSPEKERSLSLLSPCAIDCIEDMTSRSVPRNTARILRCLSLQRLPSVSPETPYRKPLAIQTLSPITSPSFSASLLRKKVEELESKLAAKQNFVRSVGHEIRTPLSVVLSGLLVLARDLESGDGSSRLSRKEAFSSFKSMKGGLVSTVESIYHACSSAIDVLNDLLIYEKIESKLLIQEPSLVHLAVLVENVVSQFQVQAEQSEVYMSLGNSLLPEESSLVYADAHKITQVQ